MAVDASKALTKNRVNIIKELADPDAVAEHLFASGLFTDDMLARVSQELEKEKKTRCILDTLKYRGKKAPRGLYDAFLETDNEELAELLSPYLKSAESEDNKYNPSKWPPEEHEQASMEKDRVIKITDVRHPDFYWVYRKSGTAKQSEVYKMKNKVRGKTLIINNVNFIKFSEREGSDKDAANISKLFTELHFQVVQKDNLTKQEMLDFLIEERDKIKCDDNIECLVLVIMSHGHTVGVFGTDEEEIELKRLTDLFKSDNCPSLNEKPKLVFVQACRGEEKEVENQGVQNSNDLDGAKLKGISEKLKDIDVGKTETDAVKGNDPSAPVKTVHSAADFLIAYATPEGTPAYRNINVGSWFLNAIVWTFKYHAHKTELSHLMVMVNKLVSEGRTLSGNLTVSKLDNSLRKRFYLFPGIHGDPPSTF